MMRVFLALAALAVLSSCGHREALDRPPPLWGDRARCEQDAECARVLRERAERRQHDQQSETPAPH